MFENLPPLLQDYVNYFDQSPVMAVLLGLVVVLVAVALLRVALKLFLFFIILMVVALVASYFFMGEDSTNDALRRGAQEVGEQVDDIIDTGKDAMDDRFKDELKKQNG